MSYKAKRKLVNGSVYIVLAIVVASILLVTVLTFIQARKPKTPIVNDRTNQSDGTGSGDKNPGADPGNDGGSKTDKDKDKDNGKDKDKDVSGGEDALFYLPCEGSVMKEFSVDTPIWSCTMCDYRAHTGIDISTSVGSDVCAMCTGVVTGITEDPFMGTCIAVEHKDGLVSYYMNLASELPDGIEVGAKVAAGQTIASVGDTALCEIADTEHLHFAVKLQGEWADPMDYLDFSSVSTSAEGIEEGVGGNAQDITVEVE